MKHPEFLIKKPVLEKLEKILCRPVVILDMQQPSKFKKVATINDKEIIIWLNSADLYKTIYRDVIVNQNVNEAFIKNANKELKNLLKEIVEQDFQNKNPDFMLVFKMLYSIALSIIISNFVQINLVLYVGLTMEEVDQSIIDTMVNITTVAFWLSLGAQTIENIDIYRKTDNQHKAKDFIDFLCNIVFSDVINGSYFDKQTAIILMDDLLVDATCNDKTMI